MKQNPRPKTVRLSKSEDDILSKVYFYSPLLTIPYKWSKWRTSKKTGRHYRRRIYTSWERPAAGAKRNFSYFWYVDVRIYNYQGTMTQESRLNLGLFYPSEINTPSILREALRKAIISKIVSDFATPESKKSPKTIEKIVIVRRFRHNHGYEKYDH